MPIRRPPYILFLRSLCGSVSAPEEVEKEKDNNGDDRYYEDGIRVGTDPVFDERPVGAEDHASSDKQGVLQG